MKEFEQLGKSKFQTLCMADCVEYAKLYTQYMKLSKDIINIELANEVANRALVLASRWSEIATFADEVKANHGYTKQHFWQWAHEHYSTLKEIHVHSRMIWNDAKNELRENLKYNGGT